MKTRLSILLFLLAVGISGCSDNSSVSQTDVQEIQAESSTEQEDQDQVDQDMTDQDLTDQSTAEAKGNTDANEALRINLTVNGTPFEMELEDNPAAQKLLETVGQSNLVLSLHDYGGFEKVGPLGEDYPSQNVPTTTSAGDVVLYNGNQIVLFYGSNSWDYTPLGKVTDLTGWKEALGDSDVELVLSAAD